MSPSPQEWWAQGATVTLAGRRIFVAERGRGPDLTLLHGYPASSLEWADVVEPLAASRRVLAPDLLGFGASEKPRRGAIGIDLQADVVEALWADRGVRRTSIAAYDYGAQARVVELDGVGHCPHLEVPAEWAAHVLELLGDGRG